jgi:hypothetical protein
MKITLNELRRLVKKIISEEVEKKPLYRIETLSSEGMDLLVDKNSNLYLYDKSDNLLYNAKFVGSKIEKSAESKIEYMILPLSKFDK